MDYEIVKGNRLNSRLLWVPSEQNLYSFKVERCGRREYICYNDTLSAPKKKTDNQEHPKCTARVYLTNGILTRNRIAHSQHNSHVPNMAKANFINIVKDKIRSIREDFPSMHDKISIDEIFMEQLAKYVCPKVKCGKSIKNKSFNRIF